MLTNGWMRRGGVWIGALLLIGMSSAGCGTPEKDDRGKSTSENRNDDGHGLHQVNNSRLTTIMQELAALDFDRLAAESHAGREPYRDIGEVGEIASELAADARLISTIFRDAEMNAESRRVFDDLAQRLRDETVALCDSARRKDYSAAKMQLDRVIATCNACHASFRGPQVARIEGADSSPNERGALTRVAIFGE